MWWSNLFSNMSPASFFNFSFLPKYGPYFLKGIGYTLLLAVVSVLLAVIPALLLAIMRLSKNKLVKGISGAYIAIFRSTPLLVQLFFLYAGLPRVGIRFSAEACAVIGLTFLGGAYMAEAFRSGLESVDRSQVEAGACIGLTRGQNIRYVIFPQALATAAPALFANVIFLIQDQMQQRVLDPASGCRMPNLRSLMADSVVFEQAHTCNAICSPASGRRTA